MNSQQQRGPTSRKQYERKREKRMPEIYALHREYNMSNVSPRKDLVRGTNPTTEQSTHTTTDNNMHAIFVARNGLPRNDHYAPSAEDSRRLGDVECVSQVQEAPSISHVDIELTRRFGNNVLAGALQPETTNSKPPKPEQNPERIYVCHTLCTRHGICESTREHRNTKKFKRRLYKALLTLANAERGDHELRVAQKHPTIPRTR